MSNGKGDKRLHARTQAPDMAQRWEATFGVSRHRPTPKANGEPIPDSVARWLARVSVESDADTVTVTVQR